jgi:hypothetical protein
MSTIIEVFTIRIQNISKKNLHIRKLMVEYNTSAEQELDLGEK